MTHNSVCGCWLMGNRTNELSLKDVTGVGLKQLAREHILRTKHAMTHAQAALPFRDRLMLCDSKHDYKENGIATDALDFCYAREGQVPTCQYCRQRFEAIKESLVEEGLNQAITAIVL